MSELDFDAIKKGLLARREQLVESQHARVRHVEGTADQASADSVDQAANAADFELAINTAAIGEEELEAIDEAVRRIDEGTYGLCQDCQEVPEREGW